MSKVGSLAPGYIERDGPTFTADELWKQGLAKAKNGDYVIILSPDQEWLAVKAQVSFLRNKKL